VRVRRMRRGVEGEGEGEGRDVHLGGLKLEVEG